MADNDNGSFETADDNVIQPFQLESTALRGRAVRLGTALGDILEPHDYPEVVARLVAETVTLALLLSSMLKYEGIFTLQIKGDGPVSMLVADVTSGGAVRGCASFDEKKLLEDGNLDDYLGKGHMAFTVDQNAGAADRYQGIIELKGETLADCVRHYFQQSEGMMTGIKVSAARHADGWRAGGLMLESMKNVSDGQEDWRRTMVLMGTCTDDEILDPALHSNVLLMRMFHEEGVRVYAPVAVEKGCRCDSEKVENVLASLSADDIDYIAQDGKVEVKCEFCSRSFVFDLEQLRDKMIPAEK